MPARYRSPSVFNFYLYDYQPHGAAAAAALWAPEAQIFTAPYVIAWLNGMLSLTRYGLTNSYDGFGSWLKNTGAPDGALAFAPAARDVTNATAVVDEVWWRLVEWSVTRDGLTARAATNVAVTIGKS